MHANTSAPMAGVPESAKSSVRSSPEMFLMIANSLVPETVTRMPSPALKRAPCVAVTLSTVADEPETIFEPAWIDSPPSAPYSGIPCHGRVGVAASLMRAESVRASKLSAFSQLL